MKNFIDEPQKIKRVLFYSCFIFVAWLATSCNTNSLDCTQKREHEHHYKLSGNESKALAELDMLKTFVQAKCSDKHDLYYKHVYNSERVKELNEEYRRDRLAAYAGKEARAYTER